MKKRVLGKGLGALIPEVEPAETSPREIDIDLISPNPDQPRFKLDEQALDNLAASIRENGLLQPVLVRPAADRFQLVAGERRLLAAQRAGLMKIPAVIRKVPDSQMLLLALVENLQREQLNPVEEAQAYQNLIDMLGATQEELALHLGKERSTIANALRLLKLPIAVRTLVTEGKLSPGHARALLAAGVIPSEMARMAQTMVDQAWSVRAAERWAKGKTKRKPLPMPADPNVVAAAERLQLQFGTRVEIIIRGEADGPGHIRIHFNDQEDLNRVYEMLIRTPQ